jgi:hypothetical protein
MKYFPQNTVANFRVKLANRIVLPRQWEVALTGLHYPHTLSTVRTGVQQTFTYEATIKFTYNRSTHKVTVDVKEGAMVWITGDIAAVLGFGEVSVLTEKTTSPFVADINGGFSSIYVYTDMRCKEPNTFFL